MLCPLECLPTESTDVSFQCPVLYYTKNDLYGREEGGSRSICQNLVLFFCTMRRGFEQESRYTLSKHAKEFKNKVKSRFSPRKYRNFTAGTVRIYNN